jgi:hypothetical protein
MMNFKNKLYGYKLWIKFMVSCYDSGIWIMLWLNFKAKI